MDNNAENCRGSVRSSMAKAALNQYQIRGELGRGGNGVVYEAYDPLTNAVVALKTIEVSSGDALYRLKQEFRALSDLHHPNLVRFGELSVDDGQWYFSMELVRGTTFTEYVRPRAAGNSSAPTFDEKRLRAVLPQLVLALSAVHEAGHVHCDVKPSNVLVSHEGRVVLLDFGLITALKAIHDSTDAGLLGTPAFMAPEQIEGSAVGAAADWYALGGMLFLALTGELPFGGTHNQILTAKLTGPSREPSSVVPGLPEDLSALCAALLRMNPDERPSPLEIRARLGMPTPDSTSSTQLRVAEAASVFVGRERELSALEAAFADVEHLHERLVVVEGEAGVGKSAVVRHFLERIRGRALVLSGRCYEQETVPFKGVDSLVDALSEHMVSLTDSEVGPLLAGGIRYLAAVFPVLNRVSAIQEITGNRAVDNAGGLRDQAFGEFERLIRALSGREPVVLFLDDLQWADRDSATILQQAFAGATGTSCLLLATMRSDVEVPTEVAALTAPADRISVRGLSEEESNSLWDALWPTFTTRKTTREQREIVMREAGGHPLFLAELVRSARAGNLSRDGGANLQDVLWERVCERDEADRRFLEIVALAGAPTPYEVIGRAAGVELGDCLSRLGALRAAQLVRVSRRGDERVVEAYHDRVRESVLAHIEREGPEPMAERRLRLGRALLQGGSDKQVATRVFAIVAHLNAARTLLTSPAERSRLVELNLMAGRQAKMATAYDQACRYVSVGLELLGTQCWSEAYAIARDLHIEKLTAEFLAGNFDAARSCFEVARAHITEPSDRTDLYIAWIELQNGQANYAEARRAANEIFATLGAPLPTLAMKANVLAQYARTRFAQRGRSAEELLHLPLQPDPVQRNVIKLLVAIAPTAFFTDTNFLMWILLRIAGLSMQFGVSGESAYGVTGFGVVLSAAFDKPVEGAAFGKLGMALNRRLRNDELAPRVQFLNGAFITPWVSPYSEAIEILRAGYKLAAEIGDSTYEAYIALSIAMTVYCESADLASVQATGEWAREVCGRRKMPDLASQGAWQARYAARLRGLGRHAPFVDAGRPPASTSSHGASGDEVPTAFSDFLSSAENAYSLGEIGDARKLMDDAIKMSRTGFGLPLTVELAFVDALIAARQHDRAGTLEGIYLRSRVAGSVRKLKRWAKVCPGNFEPYYRIAEAELARIQGHPVRATRLFEQAVAAARAHRSTKREAIALELASSHARSLRPASGVAATQWLDEAIDAYARWGATAKADALRARRL